MEYNQAYNKYLRNRSFKQSIEQQILGICEIFYEAEDLIISTDKSICDYYIKTADEKIPIKSRIRSINYLSSYRNEITVRKNELFNQSRYGIYGFANEDNLIVLFRILDYRKMTHWVLKYKADMKTYVNVNDPYEKDPFYAFDVDNLYANTVLVLFDDTVIPPYLYVHTQKENQFFN